MNIHSVLSQTDIRYIEGLIEEIVLPPMLLTLPATQEDGNDDPLHCFRVNKFP